jgi:SSS family solute:Na+ symporter
VLGGGEAARVASGLGDDDFGGSSAAIPGIGQTGYIGLTAFVLNVAVTVVLTFVLKAARAPEGIDVTSPGDYTADAAETEGKEAPILRPGPSPAPNPG